ncbi:hypothetical protein KQX54_009484 [Cotesia glomerata]|uniref:Uncharacterized protein n=1 Tax=Cotesia glomerata TaxID=32391 RepID=A0AAV7IRF0_COTGL|nr:hypothetical protein KQX54_009484 [Cotesia glomerata]
MWGREGGLEASIGSSGRNCSDESSQVFHFFFGVDIQSVQRTCVYWIGYGDIVKVAIVVLALCFFHSSILKVSKMFFLKLGVEVGEHVRHISFLDDFVELFGPVVFGLKIWVIR